MEHSDNFLGSAVIFLLAAVFAVPLAKRLRLGAVMGYLLAGCAIGPSALGLIGNPENVAHISELGVVLLLFIIGLELSPRRLWVMRRSVFGGGSIQVVTTGFVLGAVARWGFDQSWNAALVLGLGLALSSTAFGLQILAESKQLTTPHGRLAFAILLFQDIAAIPLIAMIPLLATAPAAVSHDGNLLPWLKVIGSITLVIIGGRFLLRPVFRIVAKTGLPEVSTATALLVVTGTAWLMSLAGVSMALGAFLAGLLLADSEYRHELETQIEPFKGLLLGLFFISVGMTADLSLLIHEPLLMLGLTALLIFLKMPVLYAVACFNGGLNRRSAWHLSLLLASGGEFAFVVFKLAQEHALWDQSLNNKLVLAITLSMAITPILLLLANRWLVAPAAEAPKPPPEYENIESDSPRVVVAGMGRMGQIITRILRAQRVPFVALDNSVESIDLVRSLGNFPIFYGDPMRPEILRAAGLADAEFFVVATDDPEINVKTARLVRELYPHIKIVARARNRRHVFHLLDCNAIPVRETFHSSMEMSRHILLGLGLNEEQTQARLRRFQRHDEDVLREQYQVHDDAQALMQSAREARAELETLFEGDLLEDNAAIRRAGAVIAPPHTPAPP